MDPRACILLKADWLHLHAPCQLSAPVLSKAANPSKAKASLLIAEDKSFLTCLPSAAALASSRMADSISNCTAAPAKGEPLAVTVPWHTLGEGQKLSCRPHHGLISAFCLWWGGLLLWLAYMWEHVADAASGMLSESSCRAFHTASQKLALKDCIQIFKNGLWLHTTRSSTMISQFQWPWKNKVWSLIMLCGLLIYKQAFTPARTKDGTNFLLGTGFWGKEKIPQRRWVLSWLRRARS